MVNETFNPFSKLLNIGSPQTDFYVPISARVNANQTTISKKEANTYSPQNTTTSTYAPVDARSLTLILNSPESTVKKADRVSGSAQTVDALNRPSVDLGSDTISPNQKIPLDISPNFAVGGMDLGTILLLGGIGVGAYFLLFGKKK